MKNKNIFLKLEIKYPEYLSEEAKNLISSLLVLDSTKRITL